MAKRIPRKTYNTSIDIKSAQAAEDKFKVEDAAKRTASTEDIMSGKQKTVDSFVNFAHNLGIGADNAMSSSTYGFNPITRQRTTLEWIHRGSWLGGVAIDVVADDMTRAGINIHGEMAPEDTERVEEVATSLGIWNVINDTIKWARLYGGAIAVILIDGQDPSTPLRLNTIRKGQFCGLLALDRWMVEPSLNDLVTEYGPSLGMPKFYSVTAQAPGLNTQKIHYSRCLRLEGIRLPYWQRIMENLWGLSVLERLYDRMIAFDSASTGAAQLVYKSYLRTYKIKDLREVIAAGGDALVGLTQYVDMMRRFQGIEGITLLDADDEMNSDSHGAFGGLSDALAQFGQQLSGALQIPLVRLFGQSPAGFSSGDTDLRSYYDTIKQQQVQQLLVSVTKIYRAIAASEGLEVPEGFKISFKSLWQLTDSEKADIAQKDGDTISRAEEMGLIDRATALKELRQSSEVTNRFSNITDEMVTEAENEPPPLPEDVEVALVRAGQTPPVAEGETTPLPQEEKKLPFLSKDASPVDAAGIIFVNDEGKILVLRRSATAGDYPGYWGLPGGMIEDGETPEQAAKREAREEIGIYCINYLNHVFDSSNFRTYSTPWNPKDKIKINNESAAFIWVDPDDVPPQMKLHPNLEYILSNFDVKVIV